LSKTLMFDNVSLIIELLFSSIAKL